jgi:hypothetical protein
MLVVAVKVTSSHSLRFARTLGGTLSWEDAVSWDTRVSPLALTIGHR